MATLVLGVVGAAIGSTIPGVGTALGWSIGTTLGGVYDALTAPGINVETGRLTDLRLSGSNYGVGLTRLWGTNIIPGDYVWFAEDADGNHLIEHSETTHEGGGSGGGPRVNNTKIWYTASYALTFGQGTIMDSEGNFIDRNSVLEKLWIDDKLVWDKDSSENSVTLRWYPGSETQMPDTLISAVEGADYAPAYRGQRLVVIEDHDLSDFGNRLGSVRAKWSTDEVTVAGIFSDITSELGLTASDIDVTDADEVVTGFTQLGRVSAQDILGALCSGTFHDIIEVDGKLTLKKRGSASVVTIAENELAMRASSDPTVPKIRRIYKDPVTFPGRVDITYFDINKNYEHVTQGDERYAENVVNNLSLNFPFSWSATHARRVGAAKLDYEWVQDTDYKISLGLKYIYLSPGDVIKITEDGNLIQLLITKMEIGDPGELRFTLVPDESSIVDQVLDGGDGGSGDDGTTSIIPTDFVAWSGTPIQDSDHANCGFYVAGSGTRGWTGASVYYSPDAGTTWLLGGTLRRAGVIGETTNTLADGPGAGTWGYTQQVDVDIVRGDVTSGGDFQVLGGGNIFQIGDEIVGVSTVTLLGVNQYRFSRLLRGIRSSPFDGHATGDRVVLLNDSVIRVTLASEYEGETIQVKCVSAGQVLADVTAQNVYIGPRTPSDLETTVDEIVGPKAPGLVYAGPTSGSDAEPSFRSLENTDLPSMSADTVKGRSDTSGTPQDLTLGGSLAIASGVLDVSPTSVTSKDFISKESAGVTHGLEIKTSTTIRWSIKKSTGSESGGDAGSSLQIKRYSDAGSVLGTSIELLRAGRNLYGGATDDGSTPHQFYGDVLFGSTGRFNGGSHIHGVGSHTSPGLFLDYFTSYGGYSAISCLHPGVAYKGMFFEASFFAFTVGPTGFGGQPIGSNYLSVIGDAAYNSEGLNSIRCVSSQTSADVSIHIGVDSTHHIGYIQTMQPGIAWSTRPLCLQGNGGLVNIGNISNTTRMFSVGTSADFYVDSAGEVFTNSYYNTATGYRYYGGAPSGYALIGNGTNFVSDQITASIVINKGKSLTWTYDPAASGEAVEEYLTIPYADDGTTSKTYNVKAIRVYVRNPGSVAGAINIKKYTGTGALSGTNLMTSDLAVGSASRSAAFTGTFATTTVTSGDKIWVDYTSLGTGISGWHIELAITEA